MFLHEIGKKLIQITLYLFKHVNRANFHYFGKWSSIHRKNIHSLSQ